jgi:hypothetical protein
MSPTVITATAVIPDAHAILNSAFICPAIQATRCSKGRRSAAIGPAGGARGDVTDPLHALATPASRPHTRTPGVRLATAARPQCQLGLAAMYEGPTTRRRQSICCLAAENHL